MNKYILIAISILFFTVNSFAEETSQQFEGFSLVGREGEKVVWDVEGDRADIIGENIEIENIKANSYRDDPMSLTAKSGTLNKSTQDMLLKDDVVITTETGAKLVTDSLNWAKKDDLVTTNDEVTITRDKMVAVGKGAEAQPGLSTAKLKKDVKVTVGVEDRETATRKITITCDGPLEIEYEKQVAVFNKNVVAIDGDRKLVADRVEVHFDSEANQIQEMVCTGNVHISQGENTSISDKAVYKAAEKKMILSGRPKLIFHTQENSDVSFGD